jgi:hypothetical protein
VKSCHWTLPSCSSRSHYGSTVPQTEHLLSECWDVCGLSRWLSQIMQWARKSPNWISGPITTLYYYFLLCGTENAAELLPFSLKRRLLVKWVSVFNGIKNNSRPSHVDSHLPFMTHLLQFCCLRLL